MPDKIRVGILCGGRSGEHEVSLQSARSILEAINREKYDVALIGIDKKGVWSLYDPLNFLVNPDDPEKIRLSDKSESLALVPGEPRHLTAGPENKKSLGAVDVIFPVLHGPYGEDGTVQGLLKMANIPFVGAGVLGSALGMDKEVAKRLMREAGLPTAKFETLPRHQLKNISFEEIMNRIGFPCFVKPANLGSSVGINKAYDLEELERACQEAFQFDHKIIIEEFIKGREIECAVLGNEEPQASVCGEIIPQHDFYSYEAKYIDENGAILSIPADISGSVAEEIQRLAIEVFKMTCCEGMARVDFFLTDDNRIYINEINTIPGFTRISMYPRLWGVSGLSYSELISRLIQLAIERYERDSKLKTSL
jgi:D-alanine-D-alanine ligase